MKKVGGETVVGVHEEEEIGGGFLGAEIPLVTDVSKIGGENCQARKPVGEGGCLGDRPIAGMAIDNDNFEIAIGLTGKIGEEGGEIFLLV